MPAPALEPNTIIIRLGPRKKMCCRYNERKSALAGTKVSVSEAVKSVSGAQSFKDRIISEFMQHSFNVTVFMTCHYWNSTTSPNHHIPTPFHPLCNKIGLFMGFHSLKVFRIKARFTPDRPLNRVKTFWK